MTYKTKPWPQTLKELGIGESISVAIENASGPREAIYRRLAYKHPELKFETETVTETIEVDGVETEVVSLKVTRTA